MNEREPSTGLDHLSVQPGRKIMLVDDEPVVVESLAFLLEEEGYDVRTASNGIKALELARAFLPDAVLLDITIPELDGYEVARRLRADPLTQQCFLVAITGWSGADVQEAISDAGFDRNLTKPIDTEQLFALLAAPGPSQPA